MSSISVQSTSTKPPEVTRDTTLGTDSSSSGFSRMHIDGSMRDSISSFPSQRSSNVAFQTTTPSTRSSSQDNVPCHTSSTSDSRSSTSRFARRTFASKTNSSISGFLLPGQPNEPVSEKSRFSSQPSTSGSINVISFAKRRTDNVPRALSSCDSLEIRSTNHSAEKESSRLPSKDYASNWPITASRSGESSDTATRNGKGEYDSKSVNPTLNLTETRAYDPIPESQNELDANLAFNGKSSCSECLIEIPFGTIPIDILVGCGNSKDSSFPNRTVNAVSHVCPCNLGNSSAAVGSTNCCLSSSNSSISKPCSSTSSTSEGPDKVRISLALETGTPIQQTRAANTLSSISDVSSPVQQCLESVENIQRHDALLIDASNDCSLSSRSIIDKDDSTNTSSISNIPPSVSQKDVSCGSPLLHMTISSSSSDVEFLFNRKPSETSTRSELSVIVVESPRSGTQNEATTHITDDNPRLPAEHCRPTVDKLYSIASSDAQAKDLRTGKLSSKDPRLSLEDPERTSTEAFADCGSGVRRYSLRCQNRLLPSGSNTRTHKMAYVCTIVQEKCETTRNSDEITCVIDGDLESMLTEKASTDVKSLQTVLEEDRSSSDKVCSLASVASHPSSATENVDSRPKCIGTSPNPRAISDNQLYSIVSADAQDSDLRVRASSSKDSLLSLKYLERTSSEASADYRSEVRRYSLRCQNRLLPSDPNTTTQKMAYVCTIVQEKCQATGNNDDNTCVIDDELESMLAETSPTAINSSQTVLEEERSSLDKIHVCSPASLDLVSHLSSVSENADSQPNFNKTCPNPTTLRDNQLYPLVSADAKACDLKTGALSSKGLQLSTEYPERLSSDASADYASGVRRYSLRCQNRLLPSDSNTTTQKMAYVCTIVQEKCQATGNNDDNTCVIDDELESMLAETSPTAINSSQTVLEEERSSLDKIHVCSPASLDLVSHLSSVSENADSQPNFNKTCPNPTTLRDNQLYPLVSADAKACDLKTGALSSKGLQLSTEYPERLSSDASADYASGVRRYSLRCQNRLLPSDSNTTTQKMAYVCTIVQEKCQATGDKEDTTCVIDGDLPMLPGTSPTDLKSLQTALEEDRSSLDKGHVCSLTSVANHPASASENVDSHLTFIGNSSNPATLGNNQQNCGSQSESIPPGNNRNSLTKARAYFKELCSRFGNCSTANAMLSDAQISPTSLTLNDKSEHWSNSSAESSSKQEIETCDQSIQSITECSVKSRESPSELPTIKNRAVKIDAVFSSKNSLSDGLAPIRPLLEITTSGITITVSQGITNQAEQSSKSGNCEPAPSSSDGHVRLSGGPGDVGLPSATRSSLLRLSSSGSDSDSGSSGTNTQSRLKDILTEQADSAILKKTVEPQTRISEAPVDNTNLGASSPEDNTEIQHQSDPGFLAGVTQSPGNQPSSENRPSRENSATHSPAKSEPVSVNKLAENANQRPAAEVKESLPNARNQNELTSSMTLQKQTDLETVEHKTSSTYNADFNDNDDTDDMANAPVSNAHGERQYFENKYRDFSLGPKKKQWQNYVIDADASRKTPLHNQRCQSGRFLDLPSVGEKSTGTRLRDCLSDFYSDMKFTQRSRGNSKYIRTHPDRNDSRHSTDYCKDLLDSGYHLFSASTKRVTTHDECSSDTPGSSTTLTFPSDEQDIQELQIPNTKRTLTLKDICGGTTEPTPKRSGNKTSRLQRKAARKHASIMYNERMIKCKVSGIRVKPGLERNTTMKYGCCRDIFVVSDDNCTSERRRGKKRKGRRLRVTSFSLRKQQRLAPVNDDECGCLDVTAGRPGFQRVEDRTRKGNENVSSSMDDNSSSDSSVTQPGEQEQYGFSNGVYTAPVLETQQDPVSTIIFDCNGCSSLAYEQLRDVGFAGRSKRVANDCFSENEYIVNCSFDNKKLKLTEEKYCSKKTRHTPKQNGRIGKARLNDNDNRRAGTIDSIIDSSKKTKQKESIDYYSRNKDNSLQCNAALRIVNNNKKNRLDSGSDDFEVRKSSTVHKNEPKLHNSDEAESETELKDSLYFDRLHEEFELLAAHQRKLDEFSSLGPECSAFLRELEERELNETKAMSSPTTPFIRRNLQSSNEEPFVTVEKKTDLDLSLKRFSGSIDTKERKNIRSSVDAFENMKNRIPCDDAGHNSKLEVGKLERKDKETKRRITRRVTQKQQKFPAEPNSNYMDLENGGISLPCDKETRRQKRRSDCHDWTSAKETHTEEWVESGSYLETWIERNFELTGNTERLTVKDSPLSFKHPMFRTGGRRRSICDFETKAEEENGCSNLLGVIVYPEADENGRTRRDSRSSRSHKANSQLPCAYGKPRECIKPCDEYGQLCGEYGKPSDACEQACDEYDKPCDNNVKHCDEYSKPCEEYGKPDDEQEKPCIEFDAFCYEYGKPCDAYGKPCDVYGKPPECIESRDEYERTCDAYRKPCDEYRKPCDESGIKCDEFGKACCEYGKPCSMYGKPCDGYGKPCNPYGIGLPLNEHDKSYDEYRRPCGEYSKPGVRRRDSRSAKKKTPSTQSESGNKPCDRSTFRESGITVGTVDAQTMTEYTNGANRELQPEDNTARKKQSKIKSKRKASTTVPCDIDKDTPEFLSAHAEDDLLEISRFSIRPATEDPPILPDVFTEFVDDSEGKCYRKLSEEEPSRLKVLLRKQFEYDTSNKKCYEDSDKSRIREDKDSSINNQDKEEINEDKDKNRSYEDKDNNRINEDKPDLAADSNDYISDKTDILSSGILLLYNKDKKRSNDEKDDSRNIEDEEPNLETVGDDYTADKIDVLEFLEQPHEKKSLGSKKRYNRYNRGLMAGVGQGYENPWKSFEVNLVQLIESGHRDSGQVSAKPTEDAADASDRKDREADSNNVVSKRQERNDDRGTPRVEDVQWNALNRTVDSAIVTQTMNADCRGSRMLEEEKTLTTFQRPQLLDKNTVAEPLSAADKQHAHRIRRQQPLSHDEALIAVTADHIAADTSKARLPAEQRGSSLSEKEFPAPFKRIELFEKMLYEEGTYNGNKNLPLTRNRGNRDRKRVDDSRRHSPVLESSSGQGTNHEEAGKSDDVEASNAVTTKHATENKDNLDSSLEVGSRRHSLLMAPSRTSPSPDVNLEELSYSDVSTLSAGETSVCSQEQLLMVTNYHGASTEELTSVEKAGIEKEEDGHAPEKNTERSEEGNKQEDTSAEDFKSAEDYVATLKELDWVGRQLLRCRKESKTLKKEKSLIQSKLLKIKKPSTPTGDAKNKIKDSEEEEEEYEEEEENNKRNGCSVGMLHDDKYPQSPHDQLKDWRRRLEQCQKDKKSAQQKKDAAEMELNKMLQALYSQRTLPTNTEKRAIPTGDYDNEVQVVLKTEVKEPTVVRRPFYHTMMRVTEADSCSRQFYSQVRNLLMKLREERSDCSCGDDDFKDKMLWSLWHQRQEAFRELGEWETYLRGMNIPSGTVRESLRQLQRQLDDRTDEIKNHDSEISQLRVQKSRMEQKMTEHIRHLVEDRRKHALLVKTLRQRNDSLTAELQSRKDESATMPSPQLRDRDETVAIRAEDRCLEVSLKVKDDCSTERCSVKALPLPRSQSDDMEENGVHLQMEISSNKRNVTKEDIGRRKTEEGLIEERKTLLREKDELEKKLKFRDDMIDRLTSKSKDRRGWPSFELANSSGSEQTNAEDKLRKNPKWEDQCSAFKTPFSGRFNSEARVDRPSERKREEKEMKTTGGWSSPLLANGSLLPDKRIAKQKQLRVMQSLNCGLLTQHHLVIDDARASRRLDGSAKDLSVVELDRDVQFEYEELVGQRRRPSDDVGPNICSTAGQLSQISNRMEKLEALVRGQQLLLTVTRERMTSLEDDNEFLRQQLAAIRQRTCREPESDSRDNNWPGLLEELMKAGNDNSA